MNAAFLNEWQIYRRGAMRQPLVGLDSVTDSAFDADVVPGEIRIFADTTSPLVALVVEDRRLSGWRVVPVSPFCAPASDRELMMGERVFQLWNATVVSRRFASRSWIVDAIGAGDLAAVRGAIAAAKPGRVTAGDGVQAKYEREFLVGEGSLVPFARPSAADAPRLEWRRAATLMAASLAVCLAAWYVLMMDSGRRIVRNWRDGFHAVDIAMEDGAIELYDAHEVHEPPPELAETDIDFTPKSATWAGHGEPEVFRLAKFADVKGPKIPDGIARIEPKDESFKSPDSTPMDVVFLHSASPREGSATPARSGAFMYASHVAPLSAPPDVACRLEKDAISDIVVLRMSGEAADGVKITVVFDAKTVEGYRRADADAGGKVLAEYELMPFAGREIGPESVSVTLIWPSKDGDERTPLAVGR